VSPALLLGKLVTHTCLFARRCKIRTDDDTWGVRQRLWLLFYLTPVDIMSMGVWVYTMYADVLYVRFGSSKYTKWIKDIRCGVSLEVETRLRLGSPRQQFRPHLSKSNMIVGRLFCSTWIAHAYASGRYCPGFLSLRRFGIQERLCDLAVSSVGCEGHQDVSSGNILQNQRCAGINMY
jgi:hypothetical protein